MEPVNRQVASRLYPTAQQETALMQLKRRHQCLYKAGWEQQHAAWEHQRQSITRTALEKDRTIVRAVAI